MADIEELMSISSISAAVRADTYKEVASKVLEMARSSTNQKDLLEVFYWCLSQANKGKYADNGSEG